MPQIYRKTPMPKCDFYKLTKQRYWNHTLAWVFSCKFAAYFQNTFSKEHLWRAASQCPSLEIWYRDLHTFQPLRPEVRKWKGYISLLSIRRKSVLVEMTTILWRLRYSILFENTLWQMDLITSRFPAFKDNPCLFQSNHNAHESHH